MIQGAGLFPAFFLKLKKMITITRYSNDRTQEGTICTLAEAKKQVQIETSDTDDDVLLSMLINVAAENVEQDINSDVLETTNEITYVVGDEENEPVDTVYRIQLSPLISVSKVEKYAAGVWSEIDADLYKVKSNFSSFQIEFLQSVSAEKLRFTFKTGYPDADRPLVIKQAALLRIADMYTTERQGYNLNNLVETRAYSRLLAKHARHYW